MTVECIDPNKLFTLYFTFKLKQFEWKSQMECCVNPVLYSTLDFGSPHVDGGQLGRPGIRWVGTPYSTSQRCSLTFHVNIQG